MSTLDGLKEQAKSALGLGALSGGVKPIPPAGQGDAGLRQAAGSPGDLAKNQYGGITKAAEEKLENQALPAAAPGQELDFEAAGLTEGRIVQYITPKDWRQNSRGQVRAAIVVFCYRSAAGKPTGTVNLCVFINGPADSGDMLGVKTRATQFEQAVKWSEEAAPGSWRFPPRVS